MKKAELLQKLNAQGAVLLRQPHHSHIQTSLGFKTTGGAYMVLPNTLMLLSISLPIQFGEEPKK